MAIRNAQLHDRLISTQLRTAELLEVDFVQQHLRKYGVGPYLSGAAERIQLDIAAICRQLDVTEEWAIAYLKGQHLGLESQRSEPNHRPPGPGDPA